VGKSETIRLLLYLLKAFDAISMGFINFFTINKVITVAVKVITNAKTNIVSAEIELLQYNTKNIKPINGI